MTERRRQPAWLRLWHWGTTILVATLAATGISLHFATLIDFSLAAAIHERAGLALAVLYAVFLAGNAVSGRWRRYFPPRRGLPAACLRQLRYYVRGAFTGAPEPYPATPAADLNPLQALVYGLVMYAVMPVAAASGLLFVYPGFAPERAFGLAGLLPVAVVHYVMATLILMFAIVHIYLGATWRRSPRPTTDNP